MIFAQADLGQITATTLKEIVLFCVAIIVVISFAAAAIFAGLTYYLERRRAAREADAQKNPPPNTIEPLPLPVQKIFPAATVRDLNEKHDEHARRIDGHDKEIAQIWATMRAEDKELRQEMGEKFDLLRKEMSDGFNSVSRALGRLEGESE